MKGKQSELLANTQLMYDYHLWIERWGEDPRYSADRERLQATLNQMYQNCPHGVLLSVGGNDDSFVWTHAELSQKIDRNERLGPQESTTEQFVFVLTESHPHSPLRWFRFRIRVGFEEKRFQTFAFTMPRIPFPESAISYRSVEETKTVMKVGGGSDRETVWEPSSPLLPIVDDESGGAPHSSSAATHAGCSCEIVLFSWADDARCTAHQSRFMGQRMTASTAASYMRLRSGNGVPRRAATRRDTTANPSVCSRSALVNTQ